MARRPPPPPPKRKAAPPDALALISGLPTPSERAEAKQTAKAAKRPWGDDAALPTRLKWARHQAGLTPRALVVWMRRLRDNVGNPGFDVQKPIPVLKYEQGKKTPSKRVLKAWAHCTKVQFTWLAFGTLAPLTAEDEERIDAIPNPARRKELRQVFGRLAGGFVPEALRGKLSRAERRAADKDLDATEVSDPSAEHHTVIRAQVPRS